MATKTPQEELIEKANRITTAILKDDTQELADYIIDEILSGWEGFSLEEGFSQSIH